MKLTIIILLALILTGCRTTTDTFSRRTEINREMLERLELQKQTNTSVLDSLLSRYKATIKKTERHYAPPDSTGQQPIISETEYNIELEGDETAISNQNINSQADLSNNKKSIDTSKQIENQNKKTDSRLFRPPKWMIVVLFIILVIGIIYKCRKMIVHN
ncbi:hypothetical protein [Parabacteroides provencensis]|uniref:hypothetical protein n=1 Tax=Parabacteroides provencensis TaxID=1944636 RepID=UPI000C156AE0|nr:hypothetical protein [Parabacteroides provencensis]